MSEERRSRRVIVYEYEINAADYIRLKKIGCEKYWREEKYINTSLHLIRIELNQIKEVLEEIKREIDRIYDEEFTFNTHKSESLYDLIEYESLYNLIEDSIEEEDKEEI